MLLSTAGNLLFNYQLRLVIPAPPRFPDWRSLNVLAVLLMAMADSESRCGDTILKANLTQKPEEGHGGPRKSMPAVYSCKSRSDTDSEGKEESPSSRKEVRYEAIPY